MGTQFPRNLLKMLAPAEDSVNSGHENRQHEGLYDVIVAAHVQTHDDADFRVRDSEENNRNLGGLPDLFCRTLEPGAVRKGNVQNQQVVFLLLPEVFGLPERARDVQLMTHFLKSKGKPVDQAQIIFNNSSLLMLYLLSVLFSRRGDDHTKRPQLPPFFGLVLFHGMDDT